jgi:hypothetical protein
MQRLGGGGYTRKNKRGGGNDPSCGCDMQAGWPKSLVENIPLPSVGPTQPTTQSGGGTCGAPPIPRFYQGGGSCAACSGLPLPTPMTQQTGGGQPAAYNSNPVPDACPFPGTGYCGFYARGGSQYGSHYLPEMANEMSATLFYDLDNETQDMIYFRYLRQREIAEREAREQAEREKAAREKAARNKAAKEHEELLKSAKVQKPVKTNIQSTSTTTGAQQGGANYGEPMYLQAKLRGGGCGCGLRKGGYRPTKKNRAALKKWRKGQSIGFTMTSSLKAKGLIPRTSKKNRGKKVVSAKYK